MISVYWHFQTQTMSYHRINIYHRSWLVFKVRKNKSQLLNQKD